MSASEVVFRLVHASLGISLEEIDKIQKLALVPSCDNSIQEDEEIRYLPDLLNPDVSWLESQDLDELKRKINNYVTIVRSVRKERRSRASRKFQVKSYFDDLNFDKLIQQETEARVTKLWVCHFFSFLDLSSRKVANFDSFFGTQFVSLEQLHSSGGKLKEIGCVPTSLKILCLEDNSITSLDTFTKDHQIVHLGLAFNSIQSNNLSGLLPLQKLYSLDISYNKVVDLGAAVNVLKGLTALRKLSLIGNPCTLVPGYRSYVVSNIPTLEVLDDIPCEVPPPPAQATAQPGSTCTIEIVFDRVDGVASLVSSDPAEAQRPTTTGGKGPQKPPAKGKGKEATDVVAPPRRCVMLNLELKDQLFGTKIGTGDVDVANSVPVVVDDPKAAANAKGGVKGKDALPASTTSPANPGLTLNHKVTLPVPLTENTTEILLRPVFLMAFLSEQILTTSGADPAAPVPQVVQAKKDSPILLGTFLINLSQILQATGKITLKTDLIPNEFYLKHRNEALTALQVELDAANNELDAERIRVAKAQGDEPPPQSAQKTAAAAKPKGKGAPVPTEDETIAKCLKNIERISEAITKEEAEIAKGCPALSVSLTVELNPAPPETTSTPAAVDKGKEVKPLAGKKK